MGVGLNLCETLVHHHEGHLWAERCAEGGLSLHVQLPRHSREPFQDGQALSEDQSSGS